MMNTAIVDEKLVTLRATDRNDRWIEKDGVTRDTEEKIKYLLK